MQIILSDGEWKILQELWKKAPLTITQLTSLLKRETNWGKHTVITMLGRLERKGAIYYEEGERAKHFYPLVSKDKVSIEEAKGFLSKVYNGSLSMMVNNMIKQQTLSKEEIDKLYEILKQAEVKEETNKK